MAQKGQAGKALYLLRTLPNTGGTLSAIMLLIAAPALASVANELPVFHELLCTDAIRSLCCSGVCWPGQGYQSLDDDYLRLDAINSGIDKGVGVERFTFGLTDLMDGFSFLLLAM